MQIYQFVIPFVSVNFINLHLKWSEYAYSDPVQEAKRIAALTEVEKDGVRERERRRAENAKKKNSSWSEHTDRKDERDKRKEKKKLKARWIKAQTAVEVETGAVAQVEQCTGKRPREGLAGASGNDNDTDDWDELAREEKMAKRLRKGDISQKEFDAEFVDL